MSDQRSLAALRLLAGLALATGAAAACSDRQPTVVTKKSELPDSADQMIFGLEHALTTKGVRRAQLHADTAYFYDDNNRIELRRMNTTFFTADGVKNGTMVSDVGTYDVRTQKLDGRGNVKVVSEDGRTLASPHLVYDRGSNQITSDTSFQYHTPTSDVRGVGLRTDPQLRSIQVLSRLGGQSAVSGGRGAGTKRP
jgi:LPS export ABC transporter protein LptC